MKNIKASMQVWAEDQRNLLEKLNLSENEKNNLNKTVRTLELDLNRSNNAVNELKETITKLQKSIQEEHSKYQK